MTFSPRERWIFVARAAVSAVVLITSLYVILSGRYPDATTKWAFGMVGLVVGYWLR
jgi:uncharacterized membrane protein